MGVAKRALALTRSKLGRPERLVIEAAVSERMALDSGPELSERARGNLRFALAYPVKDWGPLAPIGPVCPREGDLIDGHRAVQSRWSQAPGMIGYLTEEGRTAYVYADQAPAWIIRPPGRQPPCRRPGPPPPASEPFRRESAAPAIESVARSQLSLFD